MRSFREQTARRRHVFGKWRARSARAEDLLLPARITMAHMNANNQAARFNRYVQLALNTGGLNSGAQRDVRPE